MNYVNPNYGPPKKSRCQVWVFGLASGIFGMNALLWLEHGETTFALVMGSAQFACALIGIKLYV